MLKRTTALENEVRKLRFLKDPSALSDFESIYISSIQRLPTSDQEDIWLTHGLVQGRWSFLLIEWIFRVLKLPKWKSLSVRGFIFLRFKEALYAQKGISLTTPRLIVEIFKAAIVIPFTIYLLSLYGMKWNRKTS